ncbi:MAG TPA: C25 family cysteine peptidase, partial [Planctomycetota bacterium]|nr:C25 family cysteine peptidase [Planctomycetota bacterium]
LAGPLTGRALAQGQTWQALDTSKPPGSPAEVLLLPAQSTHARTALEVRIPGFWREILTAPDGNKYERFTFPGLGELGQVGAPDLPAARPRLAVVTTSPTVTLISATSAPSDVVHFTIGVTHLAPEYQPGLDGEDPGQGDGNGLEPVFVFDPQVYSATGNFPGPAAGPSAPVSPSLGGLRTARVELFPVQYDPLAKRVRVPKLTTYLFDHPGATLPPLTITKDLFALGQAACVNWPALGGFVAADFLNFDARYLIVTSEEYLDELEPFVQYRKSTGYSVTTVTLESLPFVTCGEIRGAIDAWYQPFANLYDHYCLLVGDENVIPYCLSPNLAQVPGDDLYGSPSGVGDLDEEVFVGRLSVDGAGDLVDQLDKIVAYETDTDPAHDYSDVLLTAHEQGAPGKYVGCQEEVASAAYAIPPSFSKLYGNQGFSTDAAVRAAVNAGLGIVAYRGHGTSNTWYEWNGFENFHTADVELLTNDQLPIVWSFSCTNQALDFGDGIGESWMESERRAAAHYGSTRASGTSKNHTLDKAMFAAAFHLGVTTHAQAIAYAEDVVSANHAGSSWQNEWMYLLLGDPAMKLRRGVPKQLGFALPTSIPGGTTTTLVVQVLGQTGQPLPGVLVSAYKPSFEPGGPDEVFVNAYTGPNGTATIPVGPQTLGTINVSARDDDGNVAVEGAIIQTGAFQNLGDSLPGSFGLAPVLQSSSTLAGGTSAKVSLKKALGLSPGALAIGSADNPTPIFGGIVHPVPYFALVPFVTNAQGAWDYLVPVVPLGLPSDAKLYWQAGILDAAAVQGISLSNALKATLP